LIHNTKYLKISLLAFLKIEGVVEEESLLLLFFPTRDGRLGRGLPPFLSLTGLIFPLLLLLFDLIFILLEKRFFKDPKNRYHKIFSKIQ